MFTEVKQWPHRQKFIAKPKFEQISSDSNAHICAPLRSGLPVGLVSIGLGPHTLEHGACHSLQW